MNVTYAKFVMLKPEPVKRLFVWTGATRLHKTRYSITFCSTLVGTNGLLNLSLRVFKELGKFVY